MNYCRIRNVVLDCDLLGGNCRLFVRDSTINGSTKAKLCGTTRDYTGLDKLHESELVVDIAEARETIVINAAGGRVGAHAFDIVKSRQVGRDDPGLLC